MARVSPYELGNVAAFVYEATKGLTVRVVESTAEDLCDEIVRERLTVVVYQP